MKNLLPALALVLATAAPSFAATQHVFENPCERGPVPHWAIINSSRDKFVNFLLDVRPNMPREIARSIAFDMCADMTLVGDSDGLTQRLRVLLTKYGY